MNLFYDHKLSEESLSRITGLEGVIHQFLFDESLCDECMALRRQTIRNPVPLFRKKAKAGDYEPNGTEPLTDEEYAKHVRVVEQQSVFFDDMECIRTDYPSQWQTVAHQALRLLEELRKLEEMDALIHLCNTAAAQILEEPVSEVCESHVLRDEDLCLPEDEYWLDDDFLEEDSVSSRYIPDISDVPDDLAPYFDIMR